MFALCSSHPKFFQPFSVLGHRIEGCLWSLITGPCRCSLCIPGGGTGVTGVVTSMFDSTRLGWLQNLHYHQEFTLCSSEDKFHRKSGPFYVQHCFTGISGAIPGKDTRPKMDSCKAHASFNVSALYTEDHDTCPPWNPEYVFGTFIISTANSGVQCCKIHYH